MTTLPNVIEPSLGRVVSAEHMRFRHRAEQVVAEAESAAAELFAKTEKLILERESSIHEAARAEARAEVAELMMRLVAREQQLLEANRERIIELARLLAERVLGRVLTEHEACFREFAEQALSEVRGARQVTIVAGSRAIAVLSPHLAELGAHLPVTVALEESNMLGPTELRLLTDLGQLDASLSTQLEHLVMRLREGFGT